jgi:3',5'-cyclic AMP phosphodiesterase CpdA
VTLIAHLTDLHFGAEDPAVVAALAEELAAAPPDLVAVSGDLTMRARHREFRAARAFFDRLRAPVLAVPGNHDITPFALVERFLDPHARWRQAIAADTEPVWRDDRVAVLGLNTARRFGHHLDWSRGRVTRQRLDGLGARLDRMPPDLLRIVVAHHPLVPPEGGPRVVLAGGAARPGGAGAPQGAAGAGRPPAPRLRQARLRRRQRAAGRAGGDRHVGAPARRTERL